MSRIIRRVTALSAIAALATLGGCVALQQIIQPPLFDVAEGHTSEFRILGPAADRPLGGAQFRLWARVQNPNSVGFTLTRLAGNLLLQGDHAATVDLPLGLPLPAAGDTVVPLDISISFADLPGLATQLLAAATGQRLDYALRGTLAVDAGVFGQPSFGPSTWLSGEVQITR
jgi:hypothetical protein